jgi:hypothetical protein
VKSIDGRKIHARQLDLLALCAIEEKQSLRGIIRAMEKKNATSARGCVCRVSEGGEENPEK